MSIQYLGQSVESLRRNYVSGCLHQPDDSPISVSIAQVDTWQKTNLTLTIDQVSPVTSWEYDVDNHKIYYRGDRDICLFFNATAVLTNSGTPNMTIRFSIHKNELLLGNTISFAKLDNQGTSAHSIDSASGFSMSKDDFIEIYAESDKTSTFDIVNMQLQIIENIAIV